MGRWTGEVVPMQAGCNWTYKLRLQESGGETRSELVLGRGVFPSEEEARAVGETQLKDEIAKRAAQQGDISLDFWLVLFENGVGSAIGQPN